MEGTFALNNLKASGVSMCLNGSLSPTSSDESRQGSLFRPVLPLIATILLITSLSTPFAYSGNLTANFSTHEFGHVGNESPVMDSHFLDILQRFRDLIGKPVVITSGSRSTKHNHEVGGVSDSQHLYNRAADIVVRGVDPLKLVQPARLAGFSGIGVYSSHLHVDTRDDESYWEKK